MTLPTKTTFNFDWTTVADVLTPGVYTAAQLKVLFNTRDQELLTFINSVFTILVSVLPGASGADNIGSAPISGVTGVNVHDQLNSLYGLYAGIISGITPTYVVPADTAFKFASNISETLSSSTGSLDFKEI